MSSKSSTTGDLLIWGKIVGGTAGFAIGGPVAALLGVMTGHAVDEIVRGAGRKSIGKNIDKPAAKSTGKISGRRHGKPPRSLSILFWLVFPSKMREAQLGDIVEDYQRTYRRFGSRWVANIDFLIQGCALVIQSYRQAIERLIVSWFKS